LFRKGAEGAAQKERSGNSFQLSRRGELATQSQDAEHTTKSEREERRERRTKLYLTKP